MDIEEAKQICKGDRIVVETTIGDHDIINDDGSIILVRRYIPPRDIREKVAPPRRKFKAGDVVYSFGKYWGLSHDEDNLGMVLMGCGSTQRHTHYSYVELICAAENREDRKEDK